MLLMLLSLNIKAKNDSLKIDTIKIDTLKVNDSIKYKKLTIKLDTISKNYDKTIKLLKEFKK